MIWLASIMALKMFKKNLAVAMEVQLLMSMIITVQLPIVIILVRELKLTTRGLFTVPVSSTEDLKMQEGSWFTQKVSRADEVTNSESCESHHPCVLRPVLGSSDICHGTNSPIQFLTKGRIDNSKNQESQPHLLELEATNSEVPDEIEALDEINSEHEVYTNVESDIYPASQGAVAYTGELQDFPTPQECKSRVSGLV